MVYYIIFPGLLTAYLVTGYFPSLHKWDVQ